MYVQSNFLEFWLIEWMHNGYSIFRTFHILMQNKDNMTLIKKNSVKLWKRLYKLWR